MAGEVRALLAELELERAARLRLQQQVSEQSHLIEQNSSAILSVMTSRVWRTLASIGGLALRFQFGRRESAEFRELDPPVQDSSIPLPELSPSGSAQSLENNQGIDNRIQEHLHDREPVRHATLDATPRRVASKDWKELLRLAAEKLPPPSAKSPLFTIITPAYSSKVEWLAEAALSVFQQTSTDWEWCVVDDGSQSIEVDSILALFETNPRVKVIRPSLHQGISGALNAGLQTAKGEFVCVLDHDDLLDSDALRHCADVLQSGYDAVYTDEDKISETGIHLQRFSKPDWSPEYFRNYMYVGHLLCVRRELAIEIGGFDSAYDRVQDFEFFLRYSERTGRIAHINQILYHWRAVGGSVAHDQQAKGDLAPLQIAAVQAHLDRTGLPAEARRGPLTHVVRIVPRAGVSKPKVSIIIPTASAPPVISSCLASLCVRTTYSNLELVCVHSGPKDAHAVDLMRAYGATCLISDDLLEPSDAYALGAGRASGRHLVFMNVAVEALTPDWVQEMLYYSEQDDVGAVGGLILTPDQIVQQAGVAVGGGTFVEPMWNGHEGESDGCFASLKTAHEVTALTSACIMISKDLFESSGGFPASSLTSGHDIDLCLRLISAGKRNIFTPHARFLNHNGDVQHQLVSSTDSEVLARTQSAIIGAVDRYYRPHDFGQTG